MKRDKPNEKAGCAAAIVRSFEPVMIGAGYVLLGLMPLLASCSLLYLTFTYPPENVLEHKTCHVLRVNQGGGGDDDLAVEVVLQRKVDETRGTFTTTSGVVAELRRLQRGDVVEAWIIPGTTHIAQLKRGYERLFKYSEYKVADRKEQLGRGALLGLIGTFMTTLFLYSKVEQWATGSGKPFVAAFGSGVWIAVVAILGVFYGYGFHLANTGLWRGLLVGIPWLLLLGLVVRRFSTFLVIGSVTEKDDS